MIDVLSINAENPFKRHSHTFKKGVSKNQADCEPGPLHVAIRDGGGHSDRRAGAELNSISFAILWGNRKETEAPFMYTATHSPNAETAISRQVMIDVIFVPFEISWFVITSAIVMSRNKMVIKMAAVYKSNKFHPSGAGVLFGDSLQMPLYQTGNMAISSILNHIGGLHKIGNGLEDKYFE